ncbi:bifunctional DNA primase/polymerase [Amycolatopsis suaedae]|uniref:bifunctional DNA primase/polymerase n=1 Tax=Amycolatopsis suaedae TaxID=2510978 RepID=UPI001F10BD96|nr:bifunctional DNA primase/polymerase [Amycolatopsis suaedae]
MDTPRNPQHGWALYLAGLGWPVFPVLPGSKIPYGHREDRCPRTGTCAAGHRTPEQYATTDPELIDRAWSARAWNVGVATGPAGLTVIDCDQSKDGSDAGDGLTALSRVAGERGVSIPDTYTVTTPSGGRHLYFTTPPGVVLRNTKGLLAPTVDSRATVATSSDPDRCSRTAATSCSTTPTRPNCPAGWSKPSPFGRLRPSQGARRSP